MTAPRERPPDTDLHAKKQADSARLRMRLSPEAIILVTERNRIVLVDTPSWNMDDFNQREIVEVQVPAGLRPPKGQSSASAPQDRTFPVELIVRQAQGDPPAQSAKQPIDGMSDLECLATGLVRYSSDPILLLGKDGTVQTWNAAAEELYGYSGGEVVGTSISRLVPPELRATEERQRRKALEGGMVPSFETSRITKDGKVVAVSISISPVKDAAEAVVGTLEIGRDISGRRDEEKAITARLAALSQSNKELEDYAATVAHDLQSPLNLVAGCFAEMSARGPDEKTRNTLESASAAVSRMQKLIKDLLELARLEGPSPAPGRADCGAVVAQALANLEMVIRESKATVRVGPMPVVVADPTQLMQVFQNLVSNAIKFRSDRPPEVSVSAELRPGEWQFSVSDNGVGIDPALIPRLFQPLQRLQPHAQRSGTGLGLVITRKIMTKHGGRIWAESKPGVGSTFFFTLPATDS